MQKGKNCMTKEKILQRKIREEKHRENLKTVGNFKIPLLFLRKMEQFLNFSVISLKLMKESGIPGFSRG